ncbi:hypothetical protein BJ973_004866 [Actinoplanes tereljensis]|uniref:Lipoprotein n=1 Tax=Paractinoplanes tereljensis TaxID=571912 RepID=A0A919NPJ2_9ACTN|nr:hypothetical protein [Actinoplanes tereljensis]GIF21689.1 hypothetical protein Ate02nite_44190 [Actinoplanes tereljensis]
MTIRKLLAYGGAALTISLAAACTSGEAAAQSSEPAIGAVPTVDSGADIVLPLDAYLQTAEQQRTITAAVNIIGRDCMKKFGLTWPASRPGSAADQDPNARRYWVIDLEKAKAEGYHALDIEKQNKDLKARQADAEKPTDDAMNVWAGRGEQTFNGQTVPAGGCAGEAIRQLTKGAPKADPDIAQQLQLDTFARTKADSRVVRVFGEWSTCMKAQGIDYPDPSVAINDQRWQTGTISKREITVATADVTCKTETKLAGTMLAVETAYQQRALEEHATELAAIKSLLEAEIVNAGQVAAGSGR